MCLCFEYDDGINIKWFILEVATPELLAFAKKFVKVLLQKKGPVLKSMLKHSS